MRRLADGSGRRRRRLGGMNLVGVALAAWLIPVCLARSQSTPIEVVEHNQAEEQEPNLVGTLPLANVPKAQPMGASRRSPDSGDIHPQSFLQSINKLWSWTSMLPWGQPGAHRQLQTCLGASVRILSLSLCSTDYEEQTFNAVRIHEE